MSEFKLIIAISVGIIVFIGVIGYYLFIESSISLWFKAFFAGARIKLFDIAFIRLQKVKPEDVKRIVESIIKASKAGVKIDMKAMTSHLLAGGDVNRVIEAMIIANTYKGKFTLNFDEASAIELTGQNVVEYINMIIQPVTIETPWVSAIARDGIQLKAKCRVTLQADVKKFFGGVGRETILARIGTGIVSAIGSAQNHQDINANPAIISNHIMTRDVDNDKVSDIHQDAAFNVISIDVADVDVGENLAARLQSLKADADKKKAEAFKEAEQSKVVAKQKETEAQMYETEAEKIKAEMNVPRAIANAIRTGKMGVQEYFELKNMNADTKMREAFADSIKKKNEQLQK